MLNLLTSLQPYNPVSYLDVVHVAFLTTAALFVSLFALYSRFKADRLTASATKRMRQLIHIILLLASLLVMALAFRELYVPGAPHGVHGRPSLLASGLTCMIMAIGFCLSVRISIEARKDLDNKLKLTAISDAYLLMATAFGVVSFQTLYDLAAGNARALSFGLRLSLEWLMLVAVIALAVTGVRSLKRRYDDRKAVTS